MTENEEQSSMIDTLSQNIEKIASLCVEHDVQSMYVFGSAATGDFGDHSDFDFVVSFKDISIAKYTDNYFSLHQKLEELLGRKIDLVTDRSLSNPYFIESVLETRQLLYAA